LKNRPDISTVTLLESSKQEGQKGFVNYQINCKLGVKKGKEDDIGMKNLSRLIAHADAFC